MEKIELKENPEFRELCLKAQKKIKEYVEIRNKRIVEEGGSPATEEELMARMEAEAATLKVVENFTPEQKAHYEKLSIPLNPKYKKEDGHDDHGYWSKGYKFLMDDLERNGAPAV